VPLRSSTYCLPKLNEYFLGIAAFLAFELILNLAASLGYALIEFKLGSFT
jgi:hypothetical protein